MILITTGMSHALSNIQNLIFDLGGVILNLAPHRTMASFALLANQSEAEITTAYHARPEFNAYEKGLMSDAEFRTTLRQLFSVQATDSQLDACWNAMLLDIPMERLRLLEKLKNKYRLFLLSNTNSIHVTHFSKHIEDISGHPTIEPYFHRAYYSHVLKMRKPDHQIYEHVLAENGLQAAQTLFLDDNLSNLQGAREVGIQTFHVEHPDLIFKLFA